jgi:hypothetical protein
VRRAWLCGVDPVTGVNYEHRRVWIRQLEEALASLFAVDIEFHVEMSNHLHVVIRTRPDVVATWTDEEVVRRMLIINKLTQNLQGEVQEPSLGELRIGLLDSDLPELRKRLSSPSWFMKALRENIARRANESDGVEGAFWDRRFRLRRLEDETAIVICGIYVDLNQIRAGEAATPEESTHTSAFDRLAGWQARQAAAGSRVSGEELDARLPDGWLGELTLQEGPHASAEANLRSRTGRRASDKGLLPLSLDSYLELLDWTGRQLRSGKRGVIPAHLAPILQRLRIRSDRWLELIANFDRWFHDFVGHVDRLQKAATRSGRKWLQGMQQCAHAFL